MTVAKNKSDQDATRTEFAAPRRIDAHSGDILSRTPVHHHPPPRHDTDGYGCVIWIFGPSASGKTTLAVSLRYQLREYSDNIILIDGDDFRSSVSSDLGFSQDDRSENIRRAAHCADLLARQGCTVICSFITPFSADRLFLRRLIPAGHLYEVYLNCPMTIRKRRDSKGLYAEATSLESGNNTDTNMPFEIPSDYDICIDTSDTDPTQAVAIIFATLVNQRAFPGRINCTHAASKSSHI